MLDDISAVRPETSRPYPHLTSSLAQVKTWDKVNSGLIKMYLAEVLGKLPVMQHFLFGSLLPWDGPMPAAPNGAPGPEDAHWGHAHAMGPDRGGVGQLENGWGDCCGIPVPSAFAAAAAQADSKRPGARIAGPGIRPVPFD